jgi:hypothetical protein
LQQNVCTNKYFFPRNCIAQNIFSHNNLLPKFFNFKTKKNCQKLSCAYKYFFLNFFCKKKFFAWIFFCTKNIVALQFVSHKKIYLKKNETQLLYSRCYWLILVLNMFWCYRLLYKLHILHKFSLEQYFIELKQNVISNIHSSIHSSSNQFLVTSQN